MLRVRPGGVWFVAIAHGLVYLLLAVLTISVSLLWPHLQPSTRDAMRQITFVDWVEVTATLLIQAYGIVQLFRLKSTAVAALGICMAISAISVLLGAYKGQPISSSIVGLVVSVLVVWYSRELRKKGTLR